MMSDSFQSSATSREPLDTKREDLRNQFKNFNMKDLVQDNSNAENSKNAIRKLYFLFLAIFVVWLISFVIFQMFYKDWTERGTVGDSFGAINSLFSGLALGGIIYTIYLQKTELALQRAELKQTRKEFQLQNSTLKLQRFENTFFKLMELHHKIVDAMEFSMTEEISLGRGISNDNITRREITLKGRDVFKQTHKELLGHINKSRDGFDVGYGKYWKGVEIYFGHYFKNLYQIIKLVHESDILTLIDFENMKKSNPSGPVLELHIEKWNVKYKYTSLLRAQLSNYELNWLYYNGLSKYGRKEFKPLIEEYAILKNMPSNHNPPNELINKYSEFAFKKKNNSVSNNRG